MFELASFQNNMAKRNLYAGQRRAVTISTYIVTRISDFLALERDTACISTLVVLFQVKRLFIQEHFMFSQQHSLDLICYHVYDFMLGQ